jgi:trehalose synthase
VYEVSSIWKDGARGLSEVALVPETLGRFASVLGEAEYDFFVEAAEVAKRLLTGRTLWNVTSTAKGGGVAEMLSSLLPLARGAGVDARWLVIEAEEAFFRLTKRIHHRLHGAPGDGGKLGASERDEYEGMLKAQGLVLSRLLSAGDFVILHDPQTLGLAPVLHGRGVGVIWRSHIGVDVPNAWVQAAWHFLSRYLAATDVCIFTRRSYAYSELPPERVVVIPPSIDAFAAKNIALTREQVQSILVATGILAGKEGDARYMRLDGTVARVVRPSDLSGTARIPASAPLVTQISRWDPLKDPLGLVKGFAAYIAPRSNAHLLVAGPAVKAVSDDPEGGETFATVRALWERLADDTRNRVHLTCLPMQDTEENAVIVNALQRHSAVVVQKSLAEGFGLTVAEAMWKERPIVATRVGGIRDQLLDGVCGLLVEPADLAGFGAAVVTLLENSSFAASLARAARRRCCEEYLGPKHLMRYVTLFESLLSGRAALLSPTFARA